MVRTIALNLATWGKSRSLLHGLSYIQQQQNDVFKLHAAVREAPEGQMKQAGGESSENPLTAYNKSLKHLTSTVGKS